MGILDRFSVPKTEPIPTKAEEVPRALPEPVPEMNWALKRKEHNALFGVEGAKLDNGRPRSAIQVLRERTNNGEMLIEHAIAFLTNTPYLRGYQVDSMGRRKKDEQGKDIPIVEYPSARAQAEARAFLADRGVLPRMSVGVHQHVHTGPTEEDVSGLTLDEQRQYWALVKKNNLAKRRTRTAQEEVVDGQIVDVTEESTQGG